jgi:hypothetical protein
LIRTTGYLPDALRAPGLSHAEKKPEDETHNAARADAPELRLEGAAMKSRADEPTPPELPQRDPWGKPPRPLSDDDERRRRRREEWQQKAETLDVKQLQADAERIAADVRRQKADDDKGAA